MAVGPSQDRDFMTREEITTLLDNLREFLLSSGVSRHEKALIRIDAVEAAHRAFEENLNRVPTQLDREAARLEALFNEKLTSLSGHLDGVQKLCDAMQTNTDKRVDAAFMAAEKIAHNHRIAFEQQMAKSEVAFTKEIDGVKSLLHSSMATLASDVRNLTGRLDRGEGVSHGARQEVGDRHATMNSNAQVIGQIIAFGVLIIMMGGLWINLHGPPTTSADTKRVDDIISLVNSQNYQMNQRLDALSNRINALTGTPALTYPPEQQQRK